MFWGINITNQFITGDFCSFVYFWDTSDPPETVLHGHWGVKLFSQRNNYQADNLLLINGTYVIMYIPKFYSTQKKGYKTNMAFLFSPLLLYFVNQGIHALLRLQHGAAFRALSVLRITCGLLPRDHSESELSVYPEIICNSSCPSFWLITDVRTIGSALCTCQPRRNSQCSPELCAVRLPREAQRCALSFL